MDGEKEEYGSSKNHGSAENLESTKRSPTDVNMEKLSAAFENPLAGIPREQLMKDVETFCKQFNLMEHIEDFKKGALISQSPENAQSLEQLSAEDKTTLEREHTHRWTQPWQLYWLASECSLSALVLSILILCLVMCSLAAAVQGMDETVNNGAQAFYLKRFNIVSKAEGGRFSTSEVDNLTGLVVGAPYLACAILGCWLTEPLNRLFARRGTIFISCFIAAVASIWEGVANSWVNLFLARFVLGLGIGSKSTTVPVYAAECSPAPIRGGSSSFLIKPLRF